MRRAMTKKVRFGLSAVAAAILVLVLPFFLSTGFCEIAGAAEWQIRYALCGHTTVLLYAILVVACCFPAVWWLTKQASDKQ